MICETGVLTELSNNNSNSFVNMSTPSSPIPPPSIPGIPLTTSVTPTTSNVSNSPPSTPTPNNLPPNSNNNNNETECNSSNNNSSKSDSAASISSNTTSSNDNQQFCLRWNNYKSNLIQVFAQLLDKESFVDVTLTCETKSIQAHRMVLSACSPYFQTVLKESDCSHPVIILPGVQGYELRAIVDFIYKGEINISQEHLPDLLRLAEELKIRGLTEVDETEATLASPSPRQRFPFSSEDGPRKRRRFSGGEESLHNNRSRSPSPGASPMAMDFLDTTMDGSLMQQNNMGRTSAASSHSSSLGGSNNNGLPNAASPSASLASSLTSLAAHLPMAPPGHPMAALPPHLTHLPPLSPLSPLLNMHHPMARHHPSPEEFEIRPGIAEMIREEERVSTIAFV